MWINTAFWINVVENWSVQGKLHKDIAYQDRNLSDFLVCYKCKQLGVFLYQNQPDEGMLDKWKSQNAFSNTMCYLKQLHSTEKIWVGAEVLQCDWWGANNATTRSSETEEGVKITLGICLTSHYTIVGSRINVKGILCGNNELHHKGNDKIAEQTTWSCFSQSELVDERKLVGKKNGMGWSISTAMAFWLHSCESILWVTLKCTYLFVFYTNMFLQVWLNLTESLYCLPCYLYAPFHSFSFLSWRYV